MLEHKYIFAPTGEIWPASSVDARLSFVGAIKASAWIDQNRAVEQMTWAPGLPVVIENRLIAQGGWFDRKGCRVFNLYRPPLVKPLPGNAGRWLHHVDRLYGAEHAAHIVRWCAHRVQRPADKINHAMVLGGKKGIGKDSLLEPVKHAVGAWNFAEVSPKQVLGRFNGLLKSVVFAVLIAWISSYRGYHADGGAEGVGRATTQAVVEIAALVLVSDYLMTALFFG